MARSLPVEIEIRLRAFVADVDLAADFDKLAALYAELLAGAVSGCTASGRPVFARTLKTRFDELIADWLKLAKAAQAGVSEAAEIARAILALDGEAVSRAEPSPEARAVLDAVIGRAALKTAAEMTAAVLADLTALAASDNATAELKPGVVTAPLAAPPVFIADAAIATLAGKIEPLDNVAAALAPEPKQAPGEPALKARGRRG